MNPSRHILQDFDAGLESLRADVLMMASLTDRNLQNAMACLLDGNIELCAVAVADELEIDELEKKIDNNGVEILLRFQPVASDLRHVISTMKVSASSQRTSAPRATNCECESASPRSVCNAVRAPAMSL